MLDRKCVTHHFQLGFLSWKRKREIRPLLNSLISTLQLSSEIIQPLKFVFFLNKNETGFSCDPLPVFK